MSLSDWVNEHQVLTRDGRTLLVLERGDPDGQPVLVHNGTPNSRLMFDRDVARARARGVRLISYDRPGHGGSSPHPGRTVADCAGDVRTIAAAMEIERVGVWGISGGGPHALACAALLPDLVPAVAVLASIAPWGAAGLDYFDGMGEFNVQEILLAVNDPARALERRETLRQEMLATEPEGLRAYLSTLLAPVDAEVLTGEARHVLRGVGTGGPGAWARGLVGGQRRDDRTVGLRARIDSHTGAAPSRPPRPVRAVCARRVARRADPGGDEIPDGRRRAPNPARASPRRGPFVVARAPDRSRHATPVVQVS